MRTATPVLRLHRPFLLAVMGLPAGPCLFAGSRAGVWIARWSRTAWRARTYLWRCEGGRARRVWDSFLGPTHEQERRAGSEIVGIECRQRRPIIVRGGIIRYVVAGGVITRATEGIFGEDGR